MQRRPPQSRLRLTPVEAFALFVAWCTIGIVGLIFTLLLLPWSLPFALVATLVAGYLTARFVAGRIEAP